MARDGPVRQLEQLIEAFLKRVEPDGDIRIGKTEGAGRVERAAVQKRTCIRIVIGAVERDASSFPRIAGTDPSGSSDGG